MPVSPRKPEDEGIMYGQETLILGAGTRTLDWTKAFDSFRWGLLHELCSINFTVEQLQKKIRSL
jgi:hypothetical protein